MYTILEVLSTEVVHGQIESTTSIFFFTLVRVHSEPGTVSVASPLVGLAGKLVLLPPIQRTTVDLPLSKTILLVGWARTTTDYEEQWDVAIPSLAMALPIYSSNLASQIMLLKIFPEKIGIVFY